MHATTIGSLFLVGYLLHLHALFYFGVCIIGGLYVLSYRKLSVAGSTAKGFDSCFVFTNKVSGLTLLLFTFGDFLWHVLL